MNNSLVQLREQHIDNYKNAIDNIVITSYVE